MSNQSSANSSNLNTQHINIDEAIKLLEKIKGDTKESSKHIISIIRDPGVPHHIMAMHLHETL